MSGSESIDSSDLSPQQQLILESFVADHELTNPQETSHGDQASAEIREALTWGFDLKLEDPKEYYDVMAGIAVATTKMEKLIEMGLDPETAAWAVRVSLAALRPRS